MIHVAETMNWRQHSDRVRFVNFSKVVAMGISVTKLLIVLGIAVVLFGTKRLRNAGSDIGAAIKNFRSALKDGESDKEENGSDSTIEGEVNDRKKEK
jgi:sec-independent protein translocase protein TatA